MEVTFKVRRQDPRNGGPATQQSYQIEVAPTSTIFEALVRVREEQDGSLAFRGNCFRGFCGDCVMRANGRLGLTCLMRVEQIVRNDEVSIDPVPYAPAVKDLLFDANKFLWEKYRSVTPWLITDGEPEEPVTEEAMDKVRTAMRCTMCGLCDLGCTVIDVDTSFLGPAALTKAFRFLADPRDTATTRRLQEIGEPRGLWDCVHCWEASEHCPYGIDPTHRIMEVRDLASHEGVKSGKQNPQVARHHDSFAASVRESGWLDERRLALETEGLAGALKRLPTALRLFQRGKLTLAPHEKRPAAEEIAAIFTKTEEQKQKD